MNTAIKERPLWCVKLAHIIGNKVYEKTAKDEHGKPFTFYSRDAAEIYADRLRNSPLADPKYRFCVMPWK